MPDLVAFPRSPEDVDVVLNWCADGGYAAIPYGGGTSVVGGIEPRLPSEYPGVVTIDMSRMDRVLEVDAVSRAARIQAGATGPRLEEQLREHGLTLRHFPQSFEYATLGGWIATRAGGHYATVYTHIDDLVESVRAVTLGGDWISRRLPGSGAGPSPDRMMLGSEGILGVITDAWVRVQERPAHKLSCGVAFGDFEAAAEAVRELSQSALFPTNCRLLDATEAEMTGAGPPGKALLVLGFESAHHPVDVPRWRSPSTSRARTAASPARFAARSRRRTATATRSAPGATHSCRRPTCATRSSPAACSRTPSSRRSPGTAFPTSTPR